MAAVMVEKFKFNGRDFVPPLCQGDETFYLVSLCGGCSTVNKRQLILHWFASTGNVLVIDRKTCSLIAKRETRVDEVISEIVIMDENHPYFRDSQSEYPYDMIIAAATKNNKE